MAYSDKLDKGQPVSTYRLEELLPNSLTTSPVVSLRTFDKVNGAVSLLSHNLETFTDSLVITRDDKPVGIIGSVEIFEGILKEPKDTFFEHDVEKFMNTTHLIILKPDTVLSDLLLRWNQTRRAFAIIPNQYHGFSVISARKLLEIGVSCKTNLRVSDIQKREIVTFEKSDSIKDIISSMFENKTRKLVLKDTSSFISDRIIMQKIARELDYLQSENNFLEMKGAAFKLDEAKKISDNLTINEAAKIMYGMQSPYLMVENHVITPWDIAMTLSSNEVYN